MPSVRIKTSVSIPEAKKEELCAAAVNVVAQAMGKEEESHVTVILEKVDAYKAGKFRPIAFVSVQSMLDLTPEINHSISEGLCDIFEKMLDIPDDRVTILFGRVPQSSWGWKHGLLVYDFAEKHWVVR